jgi:predicted XRE-type DNA-binding protein
MSDQFESVWNAIEGTPAQAENMKVRSTLMLALRDHIGDAGLTQLEAARIFGVTQPRISDLMRGRIDLFAIDSLKNMVAMAGLRVELRIRKAA